MVPAIDKARNPCNLRDLSVFYMENIGYNEAKKERGRYRLPQWRKQQKLMFVDLIFFLFFLVYQIIKRGKTEKFCV